MLSKWSLIGRTCNDHQRKTRKRLSLIKERRFEGESLNFRREGLLTDRTEQRKSCFSSQRGGFGGGGRTLKGQGQKKEGGTFGGERGYIAG